MDSRTAKCFFQGKPAGLRFGLLVLCLVAALIFTGSVIWIGNDLALIPDNDPRTRFTLETLDGPASKRKPPQFHCEGRADDSGGRTMMVRGNGDQDDNREEAFLIKPWAAETVAPPAASSADNFKERRTAVSYKDFGHLKVMSAEGGNSDIFTSVFIHKEGHPCIMGGLYYC